MSLSAKYPAFMLKYFHVFSLIAWSLTGHAQLPNIVLIISDDAGFSDWEFMDDYIQSSNPGQDGSPIPTPNLNALRERGVLFTQGYTAPVCSPSRAAIVTGSYQNRIGYEYNINNLTTATAVDGLHPSTTTVFHRMKALGYTTGVIGKWHLGARANTNELGNRPENMQVDEFFGIWKGSRNYTIGSVNDTGTLRETFRQPFSDTVLESTAPWNTTSNYVTTAFAGGAIEFIDRHYNDPEPFFLYVSFTAPHGPIGDSPDINDPRIASLTGNRKQYASMVLTMDKDIGNILAKLDDPAGDGSRSLTENTLVIFMNDNGGASGNGTINTPLNNWKGSVFEGGIRIPMIMAGPGIPSNPTNPISYHAPVHSVDLLPTCVAAAGGAPILDIDGVDLTPFLNGTATGFPHEVLTIRSGTKVGVRKGNYKLVKNSAGASFALYDLSTDLSEANNLAASQTNRVAELLRDFTAFEATSDKPRHAGLNSGAGSINLNDRFRFNPASQSGNLIPTSTNFLRNAGFENGTQADGNARYTYAELDFWTNNATNSQAVAAINNDPNTGTYRGVFVVNERIPYQVTDYLAAGGETMFLDFWHTGKSLWDNTDTIDVDLFYEDANGQPQVLFTENFNPTPNTWARSTHLFPPIIDTNAVGRSIGIRFRSNGGGSEFVSIDDVFLGTGTNEPGTSVIDWSTSNTWVDTDTSNNVTLLNSDAFAGAVLEFPVGEDASYQANNDMTRMTDLPFMLNQMHFTGVYSSESTNQATISGNELLFTRDLAGIPPSLTIDASGTGFVYGVETPVTLFDDLLIQGNGSAKLHLNGTIQDYFEPRRVEKHGASTIYFGGTHTWSGPTHIHEGTILLKADAILAHSPVTMDNGSTLGGRGVVGQSIRGAGTITPGLSTGTLTINNDVQLGELVAEINGTNHDRLDIGGLFNPTAGRLSLVSLEGGYTEPVYVLATYNQLIGPFNSLLGLPPGYSLVYSTNELRLVTGNISTPYETWIANSGETGGDADFDADPNQDGIANGLAFFLGAESASEVTPVQSLKAHVVDGQLTATFFRAKNAIGQTYRIETRDSLATGAWTAVQAGIDGVDFGISAEGGRDRIDVRLPRMSMDDAVYLRLVIEE